MVRTLAVYVVPGRADRARLAPARGEAGGRAGVVLGRPARAGTGARADALAPARARSFRLRSSRLWVALDTPATDDRPGFFEPVFLRFDDGFFDYYDVTVPFNGVEQPNMHGVLVLAIFGFCLLLAQFVAARRPLPAVLTVIAGAGWPATLYPVESVFYGALILAAALWVLAGLRTARPGARARRGGGARARRRRRLDLGRAREGRRARLGALGPEPRRPGGFRSATSGTRTTAGSSSRRRRRPCCASSGRQRGLYWRATTLDQFTADRWLEDPTPLSTGLARGRLPSDPLLPARSLNRRTWVKQQVEVVALRDAHIVAATQPVALEAPQLGGVFNLSDGIVRVSGGLKRGPALHRLQLRAAPRARPARARRAGLSAALDRFLQIGRTRVEPFGAAGRDARVDALFDDERYLRAVALRGALERGTAAPRGRADAVRRRRRDRDLAARDRRLRLRRVAAGDRRPAAARALRGRGQARLLPALRRRDGADAPLPRDPRARRRRASRAASARTAAGPSPTTTRTPGWRSGSRTTAGSPSTRLPAAALSPPPTASRRPDSTPATRRTRSARDAAAPTRAARGELDRFLLKEQLAERQRRARAGETRGGVRALWLLLALVLVAGGAIGAAKLVRRRLRYLTRDPRRLAAAARRELADFLADQGARRQRRAPPRRSCTSSSGTSSAPTQAGSRPRWRRRASARRRRARPRPPTPGASCAPCSA